ncbi:MAG: peptide deformylase [Sideroxydans sp.]
MAVREVLRMGDARLWQRAEPVTDFGAALHDLLADMFDTMRAYRGVGLAAPQIGVPLRVVIFGMPLRHVTAQQPVAGAAASTSFSRLGSPPARAQVQRNPRYPEAEAVPQTVLINPLLTPLSDEMEEGWEGCLSVPGLRGLVPRYTHLRYQGRDASGASLDRTVHGFHARVVQHECDHLDGILYPMRIRDLRNFGYSDVLFPGQDLADD